MGSMPQFSTNQEAHASIGGSSSRMLEGLTVNEAAAILCGLEKDLGQIARLKDVTKDIGGD